MQRLFFHRLSIQVNYLSIKALLFTFAGWKKAADQEQKLEKLQVEWKKPNGGGTLYLKLLGPEF